MTGCWHNAYEAYAWSNVVCVPRKHKLYPVRKEAWVDANAATHVLLRC